MRIEGVDLTIYTTDGDGVTIDLSPTQLAVVVKILGIEFGEGQSIQCFSDATLQRLAQMKGNPLNLRKEG